MRIIRSMLLTVLFMTMISLVVGQQSPPRLIVRGDDMGFAHSGNLAIEKTYRNGIATSIEIIVPSPWFPEAVKMLENYPGIDVGIHLALTSEWDNIKYRPLTHCPSLTNADGYFYPMIWPNKNYPGGALKEHAWKLEEIEREFRAQIELAKKKIPRITHISGHMGCYDLDPAVRDMTRRLAKEYGIDIEPREMGVKGISYLGPKQTSGEKIKSFIAMLESLKPGETYLFVDHPGIDDAELRAIHHVGYNDVAIDRQGVTDAWTSPEVKAAVKRLGIQLISYADLRK